MTLDVRVRRARLRYHLPASAAGERHRLDRILQDDLAVWIEGPLTAVLHESGVTHDEELLIRVLDVPVHLHLGTTDSAAAARWAGAVAGAVRRALAAGGAGVVRYRTRAAAVLDLVASMADGRDDRSWAWARLGLWPTSAPRRAAAPVAPDRGTPPAAGLRVALVGEPRLGPAALAAAIERRPARATRLAELVPCDTWVAAASQVLASYGWPASLLTGPPSDDVRGGATASDRAGDAGPAEERRRTAGPLAVLGEAVLGRTPASERPAVAAALAVLDLAGRDPAALVHDGAPDAIAAASGRLLSGSRLDRGPAPGQATNDDDGPAGDGDGVGGDEGARTAWAGLLYVLNVVGDADLEGVPVRPFLHRLAVTLAPIDADDPAALAFAGLPPGSPPPEPSPDEVPGVGPLAGAIVERLRQRTGTGVSDPVDHVCRRPGVVHADPGWIEVAFPLDAIDLDVRRCGLDMDPGWVPWLGAVVRFRYG